MAGLEDLGEAGKDGVAPIPGEESPEHEASESPAEEYLEELQTGKEGVGQPMNKKKPGFKGMKFRSQTGGQKNQDLMKFGMGNKKGPAEE